METVRYGQEGGLPCPGSSWMIYLLVCVAILHNFQLYLVVAKNTARYLACLLGSCWYIQYGVVFRVPSFLVRLVLRKLISRLISLSLLVCACSYPVSSRVTKRNIYIYIFTYSILVSGCDMNRVL